jgi:hypothetical protein
MTREGDQYVIARDAPGGEMQALLWDGLGTSRLTDKRKRQGAVKAFMANTARAAGGHTIAAHAQLVAAGCQPRATAHRATEAICTGSGKVKGSGNGSAPAPPARCADEEQAARAWLAIDEMARAGGGNRRSIKGDGALTPVVRTANTV